MTNFMIIKVIYIVKTYKYTKKDIKIEEEIYSPNLRLLQLKQDEDLGLAHLYSSDTFV